MFVELGFRGLGTHWPDPVHSTLYYIFSMHVCLVKYLSKPRMYVYYECIIEEYRVCILENYKSGRL